MLYTIEFFPNGRERISTSTFFVTEDYCSWSTLLEEELGYFYAKDSRVDIEHTLATIIRLVEKDIPCKYQIEIFGATFVCLCTEKLSEEEFQAFVCRHNKDMMLKVERELIDDKSVFFHWLEYHQFNQESYYTLLNAFNRSDYSFFQKESTSSLRVLIDAMVEDMKEILVGNQMREDKWFKQMEENQKKYAPKSNIKQWIVSCEQKVFQEHRNVLRKEYLMFALLFI